LSVYQQYKHYAADYGVMLKAVANKVEAAEDVDFVKQRVDGNYLTAFNSSRYVRQMEKGVMGSMSEIEAENAAALAALQKVVDEQKKDWSKFYRQAVEFHLKNAESWANDQLGLDVISQIDPTYDLAYDLAGIVNAGAKSTY
jgi:CO dehydrogenase maturation factor